MVRLITIAVSHYCEKARWALQRAGVDFEEEPHVPLIHMLSAKAAGGGRSVPCLVVDGQAFPESSAILHWVDSGLPADRKLYPPDREARRNVEELEAYFDENLGPHTRRFAYHHLLPSRQLSLPSLEYGVPRWERIGLSLGFPVARAIMRKGMKIDEQGAERSRRRVDEVFERVDALLADGRPFLAGNRFGAADLTFAALASPAIAPDGYPVPLPDVGLAPAAYLDRVEAWRERPAGRHTQRMYREERR